MPQKPNSKPVEYPDLLDETDVPDLSQPATVPDLSNPAGVNTQYPGYKAFSVEPFQGMRGVETFGLPTKEEFSYLPESVRGSVQVAAGAGRAAADSALNLLKLTPGTTDFRKDIGRLQRSRIMQPDPLSVRQSLGYEGEKLAEWFYPMGAEAKGEKAGLELLSKIPGLRSKIPQGEKISSLLTSQGPWWGRMIGAIPRTAVQTASGATVGAAQGMNPAETGGMSGALGGVSHFTGSTARGWSEGLRSEARKRLEQAMGAVTPEDVIKVRPLIDGLMNNVPFFWSRRGMYNWVADTVNNASAGRAIEEAPIATIWGEQIPRLRDWAKREIGGRANYPKVPGFANSAPISSKWSNTAESTLDEYLGLLPANSYERKAITDEIKKGTSIEEIRKSFPSVALGDATYQAVRRGIVDNTGEYILPYLDMTSLGGRVGEMAAEKKAFTTRTAQGWAAEAVAPLMGIGKAVAESIRLGQPKIAEFNQIISAGLKALDVLDPALNKALPQQEGMKVLMGGGGNALARVAKLGYWHFVLSSMRDFTNSTAWRTTGAVWRASLARSFERGDIEKAGRMIMAQQGYEFPKNKGPIKKVVAPSGEEFDLEVK